MAACSGETAEWCDASVKGWRRQRGVQRTGKQESVERRQKKKKRKKDRRKRGGGAGFRRQVLISNRLLVMRSLPRCSQIDVM